MTRPTPATPRASQAIRPSQLWTIVSREYLERVRSRWFAIATVFAPILFAALILAPVWFTRPDADPASTALYNVTVIDATTTGLGERVAQLLGGGKYANQPMPEVRVVPATALARAESVATRDVLARRASGYLVIDSQTVVGRHARYVGRRADAREDMLQVSSALREGIIGLRLEGRGLSADQIDSITIVAPALETQSLWGGGSRSVDEGKTIVAMLVAFFLYMSIVLYGQSMLSGVIEEKLTRVAEVVLSSVRPGTLLAGKVLGVSAVGLTQQVIWLLGSAALLAGYGAVAVSTAGPMGGALTSPALPNAPTSTVGLASSLLEAARLVPTSWIAVILLFFVLGFVFFGSLYAAVGATVSSESEARQAAQPVILLLVLPVVFIGPVVADPMGTIARVLSILPFSAPILMPLRMAVSDVPVPEVATSVIVLALACAAVVCVAARIYRVGLLMYGKRPTLRELARWIRKG